MLTREQDDDTNRIWMHAEACGVLTYLKASRGRSWQKRCITMSELGCRVSAEPRPGAARVVKSGLAWAFVRHDGNRRYIAGAAGNIERTMTADLRPPV